MPARGAPGQANAGPRYNGQIAARGGAPSGANRAPARFVGGARPMYSEVRRFSYRGRTYAAVRVPHYVYARGYAYRSFGVNERFPAFLLISSYFIPNYYLYNLVPPPVGFVWVRFGPDAILVNTYNGLIMDTAPGVFDESAPPPEDPGPPDPGAPQDQGPQSAPEVDGDGTPYPGPQGYPAPSGMDQTTPSDPHP